MQALVGADVTVKLIPQPFEGFKASSNFSIRCRFDFIAPFFFIPLFVVYLCFFLCLPHHTVYCFRRWSFGLCRRDWLLHSADQAIAVRAASLAERLGHRGREVRTRHLHSVDIGRLCHATWRRTATSPAFVIDDATFGLSFGHTSTKNRLIHKLKQTEMVNAA
jgi:hypothetical protein